MNIYYIFTKERQYLVFSRKVPEKKTQDIVFYVLTKCNISAIIFYGRFGESGMCSEASFKTIKFKKEGELCIR